MRIAIPLALLLGCCRVWAGEAPAAPPRVPVIGCLANDQTGPGRVATPQTIPAPVDPGVADRIAYFLAAPGPGVFAPRAWFCRGWSGSNGSILMVTPRPLPPPYYPVPTIAGPAVMIQSSAGNASGRFHVAIVAAQLFPLVGADFIAQVRQEKLIPDSSFEPEPDPDDRLQYLSDRLLQFITPAQSSGLGTAGLLEESDLPVKGLVILNLGDALNTLTEVRVRVSAALDPVAAAILQLETICIQRRDGCQGLK